MLRHWCTRPENLRGSLRNLKRSSRACRGGSQWEKPAACSCLVHATCPGWIAHSSWPLLQGSTQVSGLIILSGQAHCSSMHTERPLTRNGADACLPAFGSPCLRTSLYVGLELCTLSIACSLANLVTLNHQSNVLVLYMRTSAGNMMAGKAMAAWQAGLKPVLHAGCMYLTVASWCQPPRHAG